MSETVNRRWVLAQRPSGHLKDSDFELRRETVPAPGPGEFVVRVTHLSFDPTQRGWLQADSYLPAVKIGEVVRAPRHRVVGVAAVVADARIGRHRHRIGAGEEAPDRRGKGEGEVGSHPVVGQRRSRHSPRLARGPRRSRPPLAS